MPSEDSREAKSSNSTCVFIVLQRSVVLKETAYSLTKEKHNSINIILVVTSIKHEVNKQTAI